MGWYLVRRLLIAVPLLFAVITMVFLMIHLVPGDPVMVMVMGSGASPEAIEQLRRELGLDDPLHVQYLKYLSRLVRGDLGRSIFEGRPVTKMILEQLPSTVELTLASMLIAISVGVFLGVTAAVRSHSWTDTGAMFVAVLGLSVPSFWLGLLLIYVFSLNLGWLPATGQGGWERLVMPASVLGLISAAVIARLVRSSMLEVLRQDYVLAARAKGLSEKVVIYRHALKNALIPVVTIIGLQFGWLLSGTVITETVFSRQGIGRLMVTSILWKDFPVVQGTILVSAVIYLLANLVVDLVYAFLDPRIRLGAEQRVGRGA